MFLNMKRVELILRLFHGIVVHIDNSLDDLNICVKEDRWLSQR